MHYRTFAPCAKLSNYVKYYWTLDADDTESGTRERIFPDGCMELIFHYGDVFRKLTDGFESFCQPKSFVHGQLKRYMEIESTGKIGVFSIRFQPEGLRQFLKMDMNELAGRAVCVRDLWGVTGGVLEEQMIDAISTAQRIKIIEDFLTRHLGRDPDDLVTHCVQSIVRSAGSGSIENLSHELNIGRRYLERRFISAVGITPKLLTRIVRFQRALQSFEKHPRASLTEIAYNNAFYDQSHFINDFKELSGLNPKQYFKTDLEFAKYLAIN